MINNEKQVKTNNFETVILNLISIFYKNNFFLVKFKFSDNFRQK